MEFRTVHTALNKLLSDNAFGRFRVIGFVGQNDNADSIRNNDRLVQAYYSGGQFPKNSNRMYGQKTHDASYEIDMLASASAKGDLTVLNDENASASSKALALSNLKEAAYQADILIDELIEYVYQIIMDARNADLGLAEGVISNRWISEIQKDTVLEHGDLVTKTAMVKYECRIQEVVSGDIGNQPKTVITDSDIKVGEISGAGTFVENDNT